MQVFELLGKWNVLPSYLMTVLTFNSRLITGAISVTCRSRTSRVRGMYSKAGSQWHNYIDLVQAYEIDSIATEFKLQDDSRIILDSLRLNEWIMFMLLMPSRSRLSIFVILLIQMQEVVILKQSKKPQVNYQKRFAEDFPTQLFRAPKFFPLPSTRILHGFAIPNSNLVLGILIHHGHKSRATCETCEGMER